MRNRRRRTCRYVDKKRMEKKTEERGEGRKRKNEIRGNSNNVDNVTMMGGEVGEVERQRGDKLIK